MNQIKKNSTMKLRNIIKQNNKLKTKMKTKTKNKKLTLKNKTNESILIKLLKSMIKSYVKKIVTEICIIWFFSSPANMTGVEIIRTIKFDAEIHVSCSIQEYQNGIEQPSPISRDYLIQ